MRIVGLIAMAFLSLFAGCQSDCTRLCDRIDECGALGGSVEVCASSCEAQVERGVASAREIEICANCLEDVSCWDSEACRVACGGLL